MPTLASVRSALWKHGSAVPYSTRTQSDTDEFDAKLNLVCDRFLKAGYSDTQEVEIAVYPDRNGKPIITIPSEFNAVIGGLGACGIGQYVRGDWFNYLPNSPHLACNMNGITRVPGLFNTFRDWTTPLRVRFKFETPEDAGYILIQGKRDGEDVYSLFGGNWIKGENLVVGGGMVTSTKYFDEATERIVKPITNGRVSMFVVDSAAVETAVAVFEPWETIPNFRRYLVPFCGDLTAIEETGDMTVIDISQVYTRDEIDALFADVGTIIVTGEGETDLVYGAYFLRIVRVLVEDLDGPDYVHKITLDNATVKNGGTLRVKLEIPIVSNSVTIEFYDNTTAGTLLYARVNDTSNVIYETIVFSFNGSNWVWEGNEIV